MTFSGRLDDRVLDTLQTLHGRVAFSGLRRSLNAHPESLARALRRLEREGLIDRAADGYRALAAPRALPHGGSAELRPIARIDLPFGAEPEVVLRRLTGRWFGGLRWVGVMERNARHLLAWGRRDGSGSVYLGVDEGALRIYLPGRTAGSDSGDDEDAAYELLVAVAAVLRHPSEPRSVTFLAANPGGPGPLPPGDN